MESPRAQDLITDLRHDAFANAILDRVQAGPYVRCIVCFVCKGAEPVF